MHGNAPLPIILGVTEYRLTEGVLSALSIPAGGWVAERTALSDEREERIVALLPPQAGPTGASRFRVHLRLIYASAFEGERARREFVVASRTQSSRGRGKKTSREVRDQLREVRRALGAVPSPNAGPDDLGDLLAGLDELPTARGLVKLRLQESGVLPKRQKRAVMPTSQLLAAVLDDLIEDCEKLLIAKRSEPALEQMARAAAQLYFDCSGELPRRTWEHDTPVGPRDGGPLIGMCRLLAEQINADLPAALRRPKPAEMSSIVRRIISELEAENPDKVRRLRTRKSPTNRDRPR